MATIQACAKAFVSGRPCRTHNAVTDGSTYRLHGHVICERHGPDHYRFFWCGWYTVTTANHMNHILRCLNAHFRVSYASDRDNRIKTFDFTR